MGPSYIFEPPQKQNHVKGVEIKCNTVYISSLDGVTQFKSQLNSQRYFGVPSLILKSYPKHTEEGGKKCLDITKSGDSCGTKSCTNLPNLPGSPQSLSQHRAPCHLTELKDFALHEPPFPCERTFGTFRPPNIWEPKLISNSRSNSLATFPQLPMRKADRNMGVSKNRGTPKWMVYKGKPYLNWWFGGTPILGNTHMVGPTWTSIWSCWSSGPLTSKGRLLPRSTRQVLTRHHETWLCEKKLHIDIHGCLRK